MPLNTNLPGSAATITAIVTWCRSDLATAVDDSVSQTRLAYAESETGWQGTAAERFRTTISAIIRVSSELSDMATAAATALEGLATGLTNAQAVLESAQRTAVKGGLTVAAGIIYDPKPAPTSPLTIFGIAQDNPVLAAQEDSALRAHSIAVEAYNSAARTVAQAQMIWTQAKTDFATYLDTLGTIEPHATPAQAPAGASVIAAMFGPSPTPGPFVATGKLTGAEVQRARGHFWGHTPGPFTSSNSKLGVSAAVWKAGDRYGLFTTAEGETKLGDTTLKGRADAGIGTTATAQAGLDENGITAEAVLRSGASASAEGSITYGLVEAHGNADAFVGGETKASAYFGKDGLNASAEAFVGGKISGSYGSDIGGIGTNTTVEGWAGAGVDVGANAGIEDGKFKVDFDAGAGLGVGGKVSADITVDFDQVADNLSSAPEAFTSVSEGLISTASDAKEGITDTASDVWDKASGLFD
ncbi:hypothetical protein [Phytomonospora endophytica]|uniref:Uncharacterized protein YukE n=1 Tax=Phytomonospora endophytica TaxID=714109 RepID=A0A841FT94_9ACTN|nr:hypothetical protein [Phytomonospora endophytica]MBB6038023.1 uncharacterized protein YukE [Phytomonospora endophytica]GIG68924.1 hypothetical protein Pen01_52190 [Phytomonospora endophytica]